MQIICSWCKTELGEKCPHCGSVVLSPVSPGLFFCNGCGKAFDEGDGGVTDSICQPCRAEHFPEKKVAVLAPQEAA